MSNGKIYHPYVGTTLLGLGTRVYLDDATAYQSSGPCPGRVNYTISGGECAIGSLLLIISLGERGQIVNYYDCPIDDYSWTLGAAAGLFGVFVIRRRNKL